MPKLVVISVLSLQVAALSDIQCQLQSLHFEAARIHGSVASTNMRTGHIANQGSHTIAMLAAVQHQQLTASSVPILAERSNAAPNFQSGIANPKCKAEVTRQRRAEQWAAQRRQQVQESAVATGAVNNTATLPNAALVAGSQQYSIASTGQYDAVNVTQPGASLPGQGDLPPWQERGGHLRTMRGTLLACMLPYHTALHVFIHSQR